MFKQTIFLLCLVALSYQWWDVGHMVVAQIAELELNQTSTQSVYNRAVELIQCLNGLANATAQTFVESACWADDVKAAYGMSYTGNYHFMDNPVIGDGFYAMLNSVARSQNVISLINNATQILKADDGKTCSFSQAYMLRFLIHMVGDIHQPLHNSNYWNQTFQTGDMGGNLQMIVDLANNTDTPNNTLNLHAYWDAAAYYLQTPVYDPFPRPLTPDMKNQLIGIANQVMLSFTRSDLEKRLQVKDPQQWSYECWEISNDFVNPQFTLDNQVTYEYQQQAQQICKQQLALAGYRLTDLLIEIFQKQESQKSAEPKIDL